MTQKLLKYAHITTKKYKGAWGTGEVTVAGNCIYGKVWLVKYSCRFADLTEIQLNMTKYGRFEVSILTNKPGDIPHYIHFHNKETALELYELLAERAINAVCTNYLPNEPEPSTPVQCDSPIEETLVEENPVAPRPLKYAHITTKEYKGVRGTGKFTVDGDFFCKRIWFFKTTAKFGDLTEIKIGQYGPNSFIVSVLTNQPHDTPHPLHLNDKETATELYSLLTERAKNAVHYNFIDENEVRCYKCGSTNLSASKKGIDFVTAAISHIIFGRVAILASTYDSNNTVVRCLKCGNKYEPGK